MQQYVVGDVHGQLAKLTRLLRQAQLVNDALEWTGGGATLWLMGDFVDRGPDGLGAIDLTMRLQCEAAAAGGAVNALLGNHDASLLAAQRFGGRFIDNWYRNGGIDADMARLQPQHIRWIEALPAMAYLGGNLFAHADARLYTRYGQTVDSVNTAFAALLQGDDVRAWHQLLNDFSEHRAFSGVRGERRAEAFLHDFGGRQLIHGHTPICKITKQRAEGIGGPLVYAGRRCINVDGGMYLGGPGFITLLSAIS